MTANSDETIRVRPGRSARPEYSPERANSSAVTRNAKEMYSSVWLTWLSQCQRSRAAALSDSAVRMAR